uniref:Uncharacterized protein n=1 Tax=viral metagenome TaxID=1070528 RepID=A0A6C0ANA0_9ZZZZ
MSSLASSLMTLRNMIDQMIESSGASVKAAPNALKLTKSGKPRKVSDRKGKPTARDAFQKMICEDMKAELEAFKATLAKKQGAQFSFVSNYKKAHPEVYPAFEAKWKAEHASDTVPDTVSDNASVKTETSIVPETASTVSELVVQLEKKVAKKPVKTAKKAITTEVVAAIQPKVEEQLLPFTFNTVTYLRPGIRRENGNHLWVSGHLWMTKKGDKGHYYGVIQEDGSVNTDGDEPSSY